MILKLFYLLSNDFPPLLVQHFMNFDIKHGRGFFFFLKKQSFDDSLDLKPETLFSLFPSGTVFCVSFPPVRAGALVFLKTGSPGWMHVFHAVSQTSREPTGI